MRKRILAADGMNEAGVAALQVKGFEVVNRHYEPEELLEEIKKFDAIVVRSATKIRRPIIGAALQTGRLKLIIRGGVGVDNIDVDYALANGIEVRNTPNASSASVAELAIGHMLALARFVHIANVSIREGKWLKNEYTGIELGGKSLGLVGFGRIARETAKRAKAFGMNVLYSDVLGEIQGYDEYKYVSQDELLAQSDFISFHVPFCKEQGPLCSGEQFKQMKDGVYLINCARGGVVCEEALLEALESGKVAGAALDVFEEEPSPNSKLYSHPRVSVTPHIGASTKEAQQRIGEELVEIITDFFA